MKTSQKAAQSGILKEIKNNFENLGSDLLATVGDSVKNSTRDIADALIGKSPDVSLSERPFVQDKKVERKEPVRARKIEMVFNYQEMQEERRIRHEIQELMKEIKTELHFLKIQNTALTEDVSKISLQELPKKAGIYHLRFLEFIVKLLRSIRNKISEGRLWLQISFEKKRLKKFWFMAKKKGTKFLMSKELTQSSIPG